MGMGVTMIRFLGFNVRIGVRIAMLMLMFVRMFMGMSIRAWVLMDEWIFFTLRVICDYILWICASSTEDLDYSLWGGRTRGTLAH